ncbi:MAG: rod shape-determining protein RodA [Pseudomonadota bacterium]|nr:rod shape-determining protein RodA [Pseudomonadota bacterium]QKK06604.1 MAG: rod shape-determining protein RodA [Pseudomonadota bacterium]
MLIIITGLIGVVALYSAAGGNTEPWAMRHGIRFGAGLCGMLVAALIDIRWWLRLSYPFYIASILLLIAVEVKGHIGMGAQRWIDLGVIKLQPSEFMKIGVVMALARFFHGASLEDVKHPLFLVRPLALVALPAALVLVQPDLGTALMITAVAGAIFFLAGVSYWMFGVVIAGVLAALPVMWHFLHDYQKNRILVFLDPERDPLGAGYHILQSKIALGSGGIGGKGFLKGTQSHLNFLPEKQTDFIFTLMAEEWGLIGAAVLFTIFVLTILYGFLIARASHNQYGRLIASGITVNFALYVFINIAMVTGLIPVVGVPLPMISNGGSAMLAVLFGFGLILSVGIHRDVKLARKV